MDVYKEKIDQDIIPYSPNLLNSSQTESPTSASVLKKKVDILSHNDFMSVASKLSEHSRRNKTFGKAVSGMLLQMLDIGDGNGLKRLSDNMDQNESEIFQPLLQKFNCSFKQYKPKKDNCLALGIP